MTKGPRGTPQLPKLAVEPEPATSQPGLDVRPDQPIRVAFERIFEKAKTTVEKGRWFEHLFMAVARDVPDFQVAGIWPWREWPDRSRRTGLDGRDIGIDLVAELKSGDLVAIQCKCYDRDHRVAKPDVDSFISASDIWLQERSVFDLRWVVSTCPWNANAENAIRNKNPEVRRIDFLDFLDRTIRELGRPDVQREPKPLQERAIEAVVDGLAHQGNVRGKLVMACGTGKTFTALRVAERLVADNGSILFAAPTISLVSQARREWLTHTVRPMSALVVCSDRTAGGRGERHEAGPDDLVCPVLSDPARVASHLLGDAGVKTVFCTYQSLDVLLRAQADHSAPSFDLAIADEAHRTTGVDLADRKVNFQHFHHRMDAAMRVYMTATERIYKQTSKANAKNKGLNVVDMSDIDTYGPLLHKLKFKDAVAAGELSDYRVIVLGVHESHLTPGIRASLEHADPKAKIDEADLTRLYGTALAMNGYVRGGPTEVPPRLPRTLAFASRIARSKWFAETLSDNSTLKGQITRRLRGSTRAMDVKAEHLDADSSAIVRAEKLRWLNDATRSNESRMISNVKLFTEGVDVPALDAVSFLDPRSSPVDIVQSVGRVMRKAEGKKYGYIVVPVPLDEGEDVAEKLSKRGDDYRAVGQVLRALQSHDERLAETPASFVSAHQTSPPRRGRDGAKELEGSERRQLELELKPVDAASIYTHVAAASGLGRPGQMTAVTIADAVKLAASIFVADSAILQSVKDVLELPAASDKEAATVAALLLCNACLLHKRLKSEAKDMAMLAGLDGVARAKDPVERLSAAWEAILDKDYEPVFRPALALLARLPRDDDAKKAVQVLAERAESLADSLNELGYDHAGPLYHGILGSAASDGAFYTNNVSALMLAGLAISPDLVDWADYKTATSLKILDPACGTGTLLMAALKTIKDRGLESGAFTKKTITRAHRRLVERSIRGMDINYHATQLAASNMTLGAPSVNYNEMSLHTLQHGPQPDGEAALGSLELLPDAVAGRAPSLFASAKSAEIEGRASSTDAGPGPDLREVDVVLMNPPFTANDKRGRKYGKDDLRRMQQRELAIRDRVVNADRAAGELIDINSIRTFFTPLADALLKQDGGVLGKVLPTTACTGASGLDERKFLAARFHIDMIVTSHDPRRPNFSENTDIHESLLVCRRRAKGERAKATTFISLARMPRDADEAADWLDAVHRGHQSTHRIFRWPHQQVAEGDWTPAQWFNGELARIVGELENHAALRPLGATWKLGPTGQAAQDSWKRAESGADANATLIYDSISAGLRQSMAGEPEQWVVPGGRRAHLWERVSRGAGNVLLALRMDTVSGRLSAVRSNQPTFGFGWSPVQSSAGREGRGLCAWWNSTPARLLLLNRRSKKLTYPKWSHSNLRSVPVPSRADLKGDLADAFDAAKELTMLPMAQGDHCEARRTVDEAAAAVLQRHTDELTTWRKMLAAEPTVSNTDDPSS